MGNPAVLASKNAGFMKVGVMLKFSTSFKNAGSIRF